jgi:hypothetical protein
MNLLELFQPPPGFGETRCVHPLSKKIYRWIGEWIEVVLPSLTLSLSHTHLSLSLVLDNIIIILGNRCLLEGCRSNSWWHDIGKLHGLWSE